MQSRLLQLPHEDAWVNAGDAQYLIPADWLGEHEIVSECGWWIGNVCIVQTESARYIEWLYAYSIKFDEELES